MKEFVKSLITAQKSHLFVWHQNHRSYLFDITYKTIDAMIWLAEKKLFCHFVHSFGPKPDETEEDFDYLVFLTYTVYQNLPKNLDIIPYNLLSNY